MSKTTCEGIVALHVSTKLDLNAMKDWEPERISALFEGIAKVQEATEGIGLSDFVTSYRIETMMPGQDRDWVAFRDLPPGTSDVQAREAFSDTCDGCDSRVRLIEVRERPIACATAKVGA